MPTPVVNKVVVVTLSLLAPPNRNLLARRLFQQLSVISNCLLSLLNILAALMPSLTYSYYI